MNSILIRSIFFCVFALAVSPQLRAQKKMLVLGSSTSTCIFGPSSYDSCYLSRLQKYYRDRGTILTIDNRAVGGDNVYYGMPITNTPPPPGRNSPRPYNNITDGLAENPDIVLINYPSNGYDYFSADEVMACLRTIKQVANAAGKPCYVTTTQPRQDPETFRTQVVRQRMFELKERIISEFGAYAINFWDGVANPADYTIMDRYNTDGVHLNNSGHHLLFERVLAKNIIPSVDNTRPSVPENMRVVSTGSAFVSLAWNSSTDDVGVRRYHVYVNNEEKAVTEQTTYTFSNLLPNSTNYYSVSAEDFAGNISESSPQVAATTTENGIGKGLNYKYFQGSWDVLPDFKGLEPIKSGISANLDLGPRDQNDNYGFLWEGYINIPTPGVYTFELVSDDGSKLYFNTAYGQNATALVNNDGLHAAQPVSNSVNVNTAGPYPFAIAFFEKDGGEQMQVYWSGPGFSHQLVPDDVFSTQPVTTGNGLTYKYYEGDWNTLPDFSTLTPVKTGTMPFVDLFPKTGEDYYAFLWEGYLKIQTPGLYTFELVSDDGSKFYFNTQYSFNGNALVNNDGLHAAQPVSNSININAAGSYPVAITFFEKNGGDQMQLYWSGPGFSRQLIPGEAFTNQGSAPAAPLRYKYYEGDWNSLPDFNALQPVKQGSVSNIDLAPRNQNDYFAFLWEGNIKIPSSGTYTFELVSDDGSKFYFNSFYNSNATPLVSNDGLHAAQPESGSMFINAGSYPFAVTFFEKTGGEHMELFWSGPGIPRQLVPNAAFSQPASFANDFNLQSYENPATNVTVQRLMSSPGVDKKVFAYPNPFRQTFDISFYNTNGNNSISAGLYDLSGKLIRLQNYKNVPGGSNTLRFNLAGQQQIAAGSYFLKVDVNGIPNKVIKLVKSKD